MKLINKAYGNDYYGTDLDVRCLIVGKPTKMKRSVKRHLGKVRRQRNKELIRNGGEAV